MRRTAIVAGAVVVAVAAAGSGLLVARLSSARGFPVSDLHEGVNAATLQVTPMFVVRHGETAITLRPFGPDSATAVGWCAGQGFFEDPSTGAKFDQDGRYLAGPATRGLDRFQSRVVDGVLQVAPGEVIEGTPVTATEPASALPPCDWQHALFAPGVAAPPSPTPEAT